MWTRFLRGLGWTDCWVLPSDTRGLILRKQAVYQSKRFGSIRLLPENLKEINNILTEYLTQIRVNAGGYELDSMSELDTINKPFLTSYEIKGYIENSYSKSFSLDISADSTCLSISDCNDVRLYGIYKQVESILATINRKKR